MSWLVYEARRLPDGRDPEGTRLYPDMEFSTTDLPAALERARMIAARYSPGESIRVALRGSERRVFGAGSVYGAVVRRYDPGKVD